MSCVFVGFVAGVFVVVAVVVAVIVFEDDDEDAARALAAAMLDVAEDDCGGCGADEEFVEGALVLLLFILAELVDAGVFGLIISIVL